MGPAGEKGAPGASGEPGQAGPRGEQGPQGPPGKLPTVKAYEPDSVCYLGDVVVFHGSTFQARRDTGQAPPHSDWNCLAKGGCDGRTPVVKGTFDPEADYAALDIVALDGGGFIARKDHPGPCPGAGWQLISRQGQRGIAGQKGPPGERGLNGEPGQKGENAPRLMSWRIDRENYRAIACMSDGAEVPLELQELFEQFHSETK